MSRWFSRRRKRSYSKALRSLGAIPSYGLIILSMRRQNYWLVDGLERCDCPEMCIHCKKSKGNTLVSTTEYTDCIEVEFYICERCAKKLFYQDQIGEQLQYASYSKFSEWKRRQSGDLVHLG